jgi:hypothetical protein
VSKSKKRLTKREFANPAKASVLNQATLPGYRVVERIVYDVVKCGTRGIDPDKVVATADNAGSAEAIIRELCGGCNAYSFGGCHNDENRNPTSD